jgi:YD repeat-containing protein
MTGANFDPTTIPLGYTHDINGRVLSYRDEAEFWHVYTRDEAGRVLAYRDDSGFWYRDTRDEAGRLVRSINSDGYREDYTYDAAGKCTIKQGCLKDRRPPHPQHLCR